MRNVKVCPYTSDKKSDLIPTVSYLEKKFKHLVGKPVRLINLPISAVDKDESLYKPCFTGFKIYQNNPDQLMRKGRMQGKYGIFATFEDDNGLSYRVVGTPFDQYTLMVRAIA